MSSLTISQPWVTGITWHQASTIYNLLFLRNKIISASTQSVCTNIYEMRALCQTVLLMCFDTMNFRENKLLALCGIHFNGWISSQTSKQKGHFRLYLYFKKELGQYELKKYRVSFIDWEGRKSLAETVTTSFELRVKEV